MSATGKTPAATAPSKAAAPASPASKDADLDNEVGSEGTAGGKQVLATATFSRTERVRELGQAQIRVDGIAEALLAKGVEQSLLSANKGRTADLTFRVSDGKEYTITMGDTHAVWGQHQKKGDPTTFFNILMDATKDGDEVNVDLVGVTPKGNHGKKGDDKKGGPGGTSSGPRKL